MSPNEILSVAEKIHHKHGLEGLSLRRVARAMDVTPMALYRHFADKDALLDALAARGFSILEQYLEEATKKRSPLARLKAGVTQFREFALAQRRLFELMFLIPRRSVPSAPGSLRETSSPAFGKLIASLAESMAAGDLRDGDPQQIILLIWAIVHGLIALHFSGRFGTDHEFRRVFDAAMALQFDLLRPVSSKG